MVKLAGDEQASGDHFSSLPVQRIPRLRVLFPTSNAQCAGRPMA
jgi:hypothetical protein